MVALLGTLLGTYFAYRAWQNSQRAVEVSEEQLELAREQAAMRPELVASFWVERLESDLPDQLHLEVLNDGGVAAHNMRYWIYVWGASFDKWESKRSVQRIYPLLDVPTLRAPGIERSYGHVVPSDQDPQANWFRVQVYEKDRLLPNSVRRYTIPIGLFRTSVTKICYTLVCNEGRMAVNEEIEVEIPNSADNEPTSP